MENNFEFNNLPDIDTLLYKRIADKQMSSSIGNSASKSFDPHALMVKKNKVERGEEFPDIPEFPSWSEKDVKELQDYCQRMGIFGFSTRQNPKIALMQLKKQLGDFSQTSLENRIPGGYEKLGTNSSQKISKSILCG